MEPEERQEVEELLEFDEDSAAGCMTTDFVSWAWTRRWPGGAGLRNFDGDPESVTEIYLLDEKRVLRGAISLARLVMAQPETRLAVLAEPRVLSCPADLQPERSGRALRQVQPARAARGGCRAAWWAWSRPTT
jgi:magnesium transporter